MLPFSYTEITAKRSRAFLEQSNELLLWQWIAMFTTKPDHYLNFYFASNNQTDANQSINNYTYNYIYSTPFNLTYDSSVLNMIRSLVNKIYNIIFETGFLLTPFQDCSTVDSLFLADTLPDNAEMKKQYEAAVNYLEKYKKVLVSMFNQPVLNGSVLLNEIIQHIVLFGNACFSIYTNKHRQIKSKFIPINSIAITRNNDFEAVEFYYRRTMRYQDLVDKFGAKSKELNFILSLKPGLAVLTNNQTLTLVENSFYDIEKDCTTVIYNIDGSEEYFGEKKIVGKIYEYISIERKIGRTYGTSLIYQYLPDIIFIQLLTALNTKLLVSEAVPEIIRFYKQGINEQAKIDTTASDGQWAQVFAMWNNLQNTFNNIADFDNDQLRLLTQIAQSLKINPLVPQKANFSFGESINIIEANLAQRRQLLNVSLFGDVVDQLNQNILGTKDLQSETYREIQARMMQAQKNFAPYVGQFTFVQERIFNNIFRNSLAGILNEIIKYKTNKTNPKTNEEIIAAAKVYNSDIVFKHLMKQEVENFVADLESSAEESPYINEISEINSVRKEIEMFKEALEKREIEEEKEKIRHKLKMLQIHEDLLLKKIDEEIIPSRAKKLRIEEMRKFRNENIDEYLLFTALPPDFLAYLLDYFEKKGNLSNFLNVQFTSPELKRLKDLERNVVMQTIADLGAAASIVPQVLEFLKPEFMQYIAKTIIAPINQENISVKTLKEFNQYQQQKQEYQQQMVAQGLKPEDGIA
jgi:hypothetical protein